MTDLLAKIDRILFASALPMEKPVINNDLGVLIYFATRYDMSKKQEYKAKSLRLLKKLLAIFSEHDYGSGALDGFESVFWTISYLERCKIIESSQELLEDIEESLVLSIDNDITDGLFEIFYGSVGKIQYFLTEDRIKEEKVSKLIIRLLESLWNTKKEKDGRIYWIDKVSFTNDLQFIDLGMAHGICAIFIFLIKLKELGFEHQHIDTMTEGIAKTYFMAENKVKGTSFFPDRYSIENPDHNQINSRLAYCVGDLPVSYAFCYGGQVLNKVEWIAYSKKILEISTYKEVSSSHLKQFSEYDFFDIGFCHGISSILFLFQQLNKCHDDSYIAFKIEYWKEQLLSNTAKVLKTKSKIYYSKSYSKPGEELALDRNSLLNGLCGAALVLLTSDSEATAWCSFLCLDNIKKQND